MFDSFQDTLIRVLLLAGPILLAVTAHELAHGYVAFRLGDPTAKMAGRLTLNPLRHLDLVGTLVFVVTQMIGWAKPVPIDPRYFKNPRRDMIWVSLAGPVSNLLLAVVFGQIHGLIGDMTFGSDQMGMFNFFKALYSLTYLCVIINVGLAVFNLLPIPPLDGSHVLEGLLPPQALAVYFRYARYGFLVLLALVFLGVTRTVISPIIQSIVGVLV